VDDDVSSLALWTSTEVSPSRLSPLRRDILAMSGFAFARVLVERSLAVGQEFVRLRGKRFSGISSSQGTILPKLARIVGERRQMTVRQGFEPCHGDFSNC
jgi:hypothetical protein